MKWYLFFAAITLLFVGCVPSYKSILPKETQALIPPNANKVLLYTECTPDSLFKIVTHLLINENFRIQNSDKEIGYINTDGKFIGEGTMLRVNIKIEKYNNITKLSSTADWMADANTLMSVNVAFGTNLQQEWKPATLQNIGRPDYAFEKMVQLIQKIEHKEIKYVNE